MNRKTLVWHRLESLFGKERSNQRAGTSTEPENTEKNNPDPDGCSKSNENDRINNENWAATYANFLIATFFFLFSTGIGEKNLPNSIVLCGISICFWLISYFKLANDSHSYTLVACASNFFSWLVISI